MTTDLEPVIDRSALKKKVAAGTIKLPDVWKALAVPEAAEVETQAPLPAVITDTQKAALAKLTKVFGKVVPTEVRALTDDEVTDLMDERLTLDEVEKLAKDRKAVIRTTVLNHIDTETEEEVPRDKEGHVLRAAKVDDPAHGKSFSWEMRKHGGALDPEGLLALVEAGTIERSTYLAMTTQVRVVDENKVMLELKKHPELIDALGDAITKTGQTGALNLREVK